MENTWILTHSGEQLDLLNPDPLSINFYDIAVALSKICRFTGHTKRFYSVAQHSVLVSRVVRSLGAKDGIRHLELDHLTFAALMHDASEAYLSDLSSPLKNALRAVDKASPNFTFQAGESSYDILEKRISDAIAAKYEIGGAYIKYKDMIKFADLTLLATERRDLMSEKGPEWGVPVSPLKEAIQPWYMEVAFTNFLRANPYSMDNRWREPRCTCNLCTGKW